MDHYFITMNPVVNAQTISVESVTCITVKEDRHQNIMTSVALKKGVGEPWTIDRVVRFLNLLRYRASNHCIHKPCGRNVQNRSRNRGRSERRQAIEKAHRGHSDSAARNHQNKQMPH